MIYNYHTHTARCGHASGTEEEYILRAISCGITHMGFSDHVPFRFPDGYSSRFRVPMEQAEAYVSSLRALREKYRTQLELWIGFEMEYYPLYFDTMLSQARVWGTEYLILGQHFIGNEIGNERHGGLYAGKGSDNPDRLQEYADCVVAGIRSGVFSYVAHPDVFRFTGGNDHYEREMRRICVAARECGIPLEINFLGIRDGRHYPTDVFWRIAGEEQSPVTFGFDAHDTPSAYDGDSLTRAEELVRTCGLNYIGRPRLILLQEADQG